MIQGGPIETALSKDGMCYRICTINWSTLELDELSQFKFYCTIRLKRSEIRTEEKWKQTLVVSKKYSGRLEVEMR